MDNLKIAVIGAGSSYTPELMDGLIAKAKSLPVSEVAFVDIEEGREKVEIVHALTQRMFEKAGLKTKVYIQFDRREALKGCTYVITQFRVGGLDARASDEKIPMKYNTIGQETTGPGGFAKALRTIPVILSIVKDMEEICPDAWLINFANPSGIITETVKAYSKIKCLGLCNVPINLERNLAKEFKAEPEDLYCEFVGLNHLSWIKKVYVKGVDRTEELFTSSIFEQSIMNNVPAVPGAKELIKTLKLIPSPYLHYFYFENHMLKEERESVEKGDGTRADKVKKVEAELFQLYKNPDLNEKPQQLSERGGAYYSEVAIALIDSIHNNLGKIHVLNVPNQGAMPDLPSLSVIETNCIVNSTGAHPIASGKLPDSIRGLITQVKIYEEYTIKAAVTGDRESAYLALLNHPLVHGSDVAVDLLNDILEANQKYLPAFFPKK
ncbi:MAG: 6-phospho-beta-glucosidase [Clostridia bacterium]|nr:6-phospho-beta-glucosidase [Clostridia bacterium]